jgi:NAD(P)-dependent dehydrogenase (short-subunit alcohol dehydrogenase family)
VKIERKAALVTGAARGIGRAIAVRLAREGARVVVADIDPADGHRSLDTIRATGAEASFVLADVRNEDEVRAMIDHALEVFGHLDILVNNAGGYDEPVFPGAPIEHWTAALDLNLRSAMLAIHHAVEAMAARGGAIVNIASSAGLGLAVHPGPEYAAAKAALMRLTACLAPLAERGIRVNCVCPHTVGTEAVRRTITELAAAGQELPAPLRDPLLEPEEVADAVIDFARDERLAGRVLVCRGGEARRLLGTAAGGGAPIPEGPETTMRVGFVEADELRATVERMEARLRSADNEAAARLLSGYEALLPRFSADLQDERDELLSRGAALMLIQHFASDS